MDDAGRRVLPLAGFSWGFNIDSGSRITLQQVQALTTVDWDAHLPYLHASYPGWALINGNRGGEPVKSFAPPTSTPG